MYRDTQPTHPSHQRYTAKDALVDQLSSSNSDFIEPQSDDAIVLGDHTIIPSDDFTSFECLDCETELEVPEIFQASGGFNAIAYQLYIFGHFLNETCPGYNEEMQRLVEAQKKYGTTGSYTPIDSTTTTTVKKGDTYRTSDGEVLQYYGVVGGHPVWLDERGNIISAKEAASNMSPAYTDEFLNEVNTNLDGVKDSTLGVDYSTPGGVPKDPLDSSDDGRDTSSPSVKEKFAAEMLNRKL